MARPVETLRPYTLLLTAPATLLWARGLGGLVGPLVVVAHASGVLLLTALLVRRDLADGLDPRLGLTRDRFSIDRDTLEVATPVLMAVTAALAIALLLIAFWVGVYAVAALLVGAWATSLGRATRHRMHEVVLPALLVVGPAMLLRADAWDGDARTIAPIGAADLGASWLIGVCLGAVILLAALRDRTADLRLGVATTATRLTRPGAAALVWFWMLVIVLLASAGVGAGWWHWFTPALVGWTVASALACVTRRWDGYALGLSLTGFGLTALLAALTAP